MIKIRKRQIGALLGVIALGTLVSSTASASIPATDGTIHSCYRPTGVAQGELVVIDDTATCPTGYTALDWNQQGPAGVSGYEIVTVVQTNPFLSPSTTVNCPTGKKAISGGLKWNGLGTTSLTAFHMISSYPTANGAGWRVDYWTNSSDTLDAYAVCAAA